MQYSSNRSQPGFLSALFVCAFLLMIAGWTFQSASTHPIHAADLKDATTISVSSPSSAPDLVISSVTISPTNLLTNTTGDIQITIKNQGDAPAMGFSTWLYVDPPTTLPTATTITTAETYFEIPLLAGEVFTWTRTGHTFAGAAPQIIIWVDPPWENRVAEANEQNNLYPSATAQLIDITPAQATAGSTQLTVTVTAINSHFVDGVTTANFGAGVTISAVHVLTATKAIVTLGISANAAPGPRVVSLQTADEMAVGVNLFTVDVPAQPTLTVITPNHAAPGSTLEVTITATHTNFLATTMADFGSGIGVQALTVTNPTLLQARLQVNNDAAPGSRTVTVTTVYSDSIDQILLENGFTVDPPGPRDATLAVIPSPTTLLLNRVRSFDVVVTPGETPVNGVQIHGQVDPTYLTLQQVISRTDNLPQVMESPQFDPVTGEFHYAAGALNGHFTEPFVVLSVVAKANAITPETGTAITLLDSFPATDITGLAGSILQTVTAATVHITADAGSAILQGKVDLQGRPAKPHAAWSVPLTIELTDLENSDQPLIRQRVTTDERGEFTLGGLPIGQYYIRVKGDHTLGSAIERVELAPGENRLYLGTLLEGDVEHERSNNSVNTIDFGLLSGALDRCDGDEGYLAWADLDELDDCVTMLDAALLVANFNVAGDRTYPSPDRVPAPIAVGSAATAHLTFVAEDSLTGTLTITGDLYTTLQLPLYVDPGAAGEPVLAVSGHYTYDADLLEVTALDLSSNPTTQLMQSRVDNRVGSLHFQLIMSPAHAITALRQVALIKVRIKQATTGSSLTAVRSGTQATALVGPNGNALADAGGITLVSKDGTPIANQENRQYLPIIVR